MASDAELDVIKKVQAHLLIGDTRAAAQLALSGINYFNASPSLYAAAIEAFAADGDETAMFWTWRDYQDKFPQQAQKDESVVESMAWGVISKAQRSPSPIVRHCGLLAAFLGQGAKSVSLLQRYCCDPNSNVRSAAVKLASTMRDAPLQATILELMQKEKDKKVRCRAIEAIGKMNIKQGRHLLFSIISDEKASLEEKGAAIKSLILLLDRLDRPEIMQLISSNRAGLRLLACQSIAYLRSVENGDLLIPLLSDNHSEVRMAALYALGLLRTKKFVNHDVLELAKQRLSDPCPEVAIAAAWLTTIFQPAIAANAFAPFFKHPSRNIQWTAAAALSATGHYGLPFATEIFSQAKDPFVKMNLALGMIQQQSNVHSACEALHQGLMTETGRWAWKEDQHFSILLPTAFSDEEYLDDDPETLNLLVRLEILNILSVLHFPKAQEAIKAFLQQKRHGISGMAAVLLLTEGDSEALQLVHHLLQDPSPHIKMEAALILALWGRDEKVCTLLQESYASADREKKEQLLEGIGRLGMRSTLPFLCQCLHESQPTLRLIAAAAILQCLYH